MTTTQPGYRSWSGRRTTTLPDTAQLIAKLPPTWTPVPIGQRTSMLAFCERCDHLARLGFGPGEQLCASCEIAEIEDRRAGVAPPKPVQRPALRRSRR